MNPGHLHLAEAMRLGAEPRQILEYLWALKNLTSPPVRRVQDYEWVRFADELPSECGCHLFGAGAEDPEAWLEVHRQEIAPAPPPPEVLRVWLAGPYDNEQVEPHVLPERPAADARPAERFDGDPGRAEALREWRARWDAWAAAARPRRRTQRLYGELFALRQRFEREGDLLEFAFGHGMLQWTVGGVRIERPILVTRVDLLFDARQGVFHLKPTSRGTALETEMLSGLDIPALKDLARLERRFHDEPVDPLEPDAADPYFQEFAQTLHPEGRWLADPDAPARPSHPVIRPGAVLFVRVRSGELWKQELQADLRALEDGMVVPAPFRALVEGTGQGDGRAEAGDEGDEGDLLFPLPANEDQRDIARRLERHAGVTVQGPPGTGKSHTIANLISHLLAQGKRVLVTSQTEKALRVLRERIPEAIRPLCVSVLGADQRSMQEIENAIRAIQEQLASLDPDALDGEVDALWEACKTTRRRISALTLQLRQAAEREHVPLQWRDQALSRMEVARRVAAGEVAHGWLPDELRLDDDPPLTDEAMRRLWQLLGDIRPEDVDDATGGLPELAGLETPDAFAAAVAEGAALAAAAAPGDQALAAYALPDGREALDGLGRCLDRVAGGRDLMEDPCWRQVLADLLASPDRRAPWLSLMQQARAELSEIAELTARLAPHDVRPPEAVALGDLERDLAALAAAYAHGTPGPLFRLTAGRRLKYLTDGAWVDGRGLDAPDRVAVLRSHLRLQDVRRQLARRWNSMLAPVGGAPADPADARLGARVDDALRALDRLVELASAIAELQAEAAQASLRVPAGLVWTDWAAIAPVAQAVEAAAAAVARREWEQGWADRLAALRRGAGRPGASPAWRALEEAWRLKDPEAWERGLTRVAGLHQTADRLGELDLLLSRLASVAPRWADEVRGSMGDPPPFPAQWRTAWEWRQLDGWLRATATDVAALEAALADEQARERRRIADLVARSTWAQQVRRVTPEQRAALFAWKNRVARIGKGTGKYAGRYRAQAREEMARAQGAIPVWIMPIHRVIESMGVTGERFDVVIVDEASQCDVFSLVVLLRADRAVIVGDDEQISPAAVGVPLDEVHALIERHLQGVPHRASFDPQTSLYDHAVRVFPGTLMLKEHFRCVPEIIAFSNDLSYDGRIVPLRVPLPGERLDPPVVTRRVQGTCDASAGNVNLAEAEAIVADALRLVRDPAAQGLTFGVISLLGEAQATLIFDRLRAALPEEEIEARRLVCGDAYAFQGDERDIVFLSMVSAPNVRFAALTRREFKQRFNVAASRARQQLRLYHSVDLHDLSSEDMRYRLLDYCLHPRTAGGASAAEPETPFERDVLQALRARGLTVYPQMTVGHCRIDLVVQGARARLAVDCDGDRWEGPERWMQDRARQQVLQRAGWTFFRLLAGNYYRDPDAALEPLWTVLRELGIA